MNFKILAILLAILGTNLLADSAHSMLARVNPVVRKIHVNQALRFYSAKNTLKKVRLKNEIKTQDNSWKKSLFNVLKEEINFEKERSLSVPVSFLEAGPGSIHEGSIEQFYKNSMQEERPGPFNMETLSS